MVLRIFTLLLTHSIREVGQMLDAEGIPTPGGSPRWAFKTIRAIAMHPVYKGDWRYAVDSPVARRSDVDPGGISVPVPAIVDAALDEA